MQERRQHERHRVWFPLRIDTDTRRDRLGISFDASASGVCLGTRSRLEVGDRLTLSFRMLEDASPWRTVQGRVVRSELDDGPDAPELFPRRVAVAFDAPRPDFEPMLAAAAANPPSWA